VNRNGILYMDNCKFVLGLENAHVHLLFSRSNKQIRYNMFPTNIFVRLQRVIMV
jgi:hypothetical protein